MIGMPYTSFGQATPLPDGGSSSSSSEGPCDGWSWGFGDFDPDAPEIAHAKTYADDAAGRRERLDDLGAEIAAAQARLGSRR